DLAGVARGHADRLRATIAEAVHETYPAQVEPEGYLSVVLTKGKTEVPLRRLKRGVRDARP
ncbi:MAG: hypothetical protein LC620_07925, partial [Halobacteriales archaeon]|nr:hypothetical protein [Halobacteriales archaeon]